jgi:hypothetical protein
MNSSPGNDSRFQQFVFKLRLFTLGGKFDPMSKVSNYRDNAAESIDLANRASTVADKARLLSLAEKWLDLAEFARRRAWPQHEETQGDFPLASNAGVGESKMD